MTPVFYSETNNTCKPICKDFFSKESKGSFNSIVSGNRLQVTLNDNNIGKNIRVYQNPISIFIVRFFDLTTNLEINGKSFVVNTKSFTKHIVDINKTNKNCINRLIKESPVLGFKQYFT
ncbi:MAG: hypothetical protein Q8K60_08480 [Parachlamydiaceae bacterium]|nr:hypothetical protein [Parachlamydiaceae bacterium]